MTTKKSEDIMGSRPEAFMAPVVEVDAILTGDGADTLDLTPRPASKSKTEPTGASSGTRPVAPC